MGIYVTHLMSVEMTNVALSEVMAFIVDVFYDRNQIWPVISISACDLNLPLGK